MIISIASGKGGTGKTFVSTNLALSLSEVRRVQLIDCDVEEPNDHLFLKPEFFDEKPVFMKIPEIDESRCTHCGKCTEVCEFNALAVLPSKVLLFEHLCHGCGACETFCPEKAITERERKIGIVKFGKAGKLEFIQGELMVGEAISPPIIREAKKYIDKSKTVIIDSSPGTSCPVVQAVKETDFCILVTEPTPFGFNDFKLAVEMVRELHVPAGVVINRILTPENSSQKHFSAIEKDKASENCVTGSNGIMENVHELYGEGSLGGYYGILKDYCADNNIHILMEIPLNREIAEFYSRGIPLVAKRPDCKKYFVEMYEKIESILGKSTGE